MKKTLLIIGLIIVAIVVGIEIYAVVSGRSAKQKEEWAFNKQSHEDAAQNAKYNSSLSYYFDDNGAVKTEPASPRIEWKINGSDQPLRGKAPLSFTLSWKIDPALELDFCEIMGPDARNAYTSTRWGLADKLLKTYEGSLEFKDVVPAPYAYDNDSDLSRLSSVPLYHGVASFWSGVNYISISCAKDMANSLYDEREVSVWIDQ